MFDELPIGIYRHTAPNFVTSRLGKKNDPLTIKDNDNARNRKWMLEGNIDPSTGEVCDPSDWLVCRM